MTAKKETLLAFVERLEREANERGSNPKAVAALMLARNLYKDRLEKDSPETCADAAYDELSVSQTFAVLLPGGPGIAVKVSDWRYGEDIPF